MIFSISLGSDFASPWDTILQTNGSSAFFTLSSKETVVGLLRYLQGRPWEEVNDGIIALKKLRACERMLSEL